MEVLLAHYDLSLVFGYALYFISPPACQFQPRFYCLYTRIHRQHFIVPEQLCDILLIFTQHIIMKRARREREALSLFYERLYYPRMAMALVDRRIARQEVVVP